MFDYSKTELVNINSALEPKLAWAADRRAELEQLSNDSVRLLSCTENRLSDYTNKGFFKRCWYKLSGKTGAIERANQNDLIDMQKYAWQYLSLLNERDLMLAHSVITIKNNLRSLEILHEDVRTEINRMADKIYNRFCEHENRIQELETTTAIHSWIFALEAYNYDQRFTPHFRLLRVVNDFYSLKQKDWKNQEIRLLQKAIKEIDLPWKKEISLSMFINELIDEIEESSLNNFTNLLYIGHGKPEQPIPLAFIAENISIPSYSALYQVAGTYTGSSEIINVLQDELSIDKKSAIKKVLSTFIRKQGIDLSVCLPLRDLAVELLSCMSLTKSLFELGNVEYIDDYIAVSKKDSTHKPYACGTPKIGNNDELKKIIQPTDEVADDKDNSFESYLRKAEKGDADAQYEVAECYYNGKGTYQSHSKAFEWYMKAAEQGDSDAQYSVAHCYYWGNGVPKNLIQAIVYFDKAAKAGNYIGLAAIAFIKNDRTLRSDVYIHNICMDADKKKNAISAYGWDIKEEYVVVLYDSTFFGSGKEGFIITDDLVIVTSTEPKKGYDLKRESHRFFNSDSYKKLSQVIKDSLGVLMQKYNEYSPNW